jgi:hypothetical protein
MSARNASSAAARAAVRSRAGAGRARRRFFAPVNLLTSVVLVFPLLIAYQLGLLVSPAAANGADLITGRVIALLGRSAWNYLLFNLALMVLFAVLLGVLRRRQEFDTRLFLPVLVESAIYALLVGPIIVWTMTAIGINPKLALDGLVAPLAAAQGAGGGGAPAGAAEAQLGALSRVALSLGAGVHEELVFRLAMIPALAWLLEKLGGLGRFLSLASAFVVSSLLFSAAHHVIGGEAWAVAPFVYRFFCGLIFASLFQFRGLAVAVYTHALYDLYVMFAR